MTYIPDDIYERIEELKKRWELSDALEIVNSILVKDPCNEKALFQVVDIEYLRWNISNAEKPVDFLMRFKWTDDPMTFYVKWVLEMEKTNWIEAKRCLEKPSKCLIHQILRLGDVIDCQNIGMEIERDE